MSVAKQVVLVCDLCGSDKHVETVRFSRIGDKPFEVDICQSCWDKRIAIYAGKSRPARRQPRPRQKLEVVTLPPQPGEVTAPAE